MSQWFTIFWESTQGVADFYLKNLLFQVPWQQNYLWALLLISILIWVLELVFPWRKNQSIFRKEFFTDLAHMLFNFVVFSIAISGFYAVIEYQISRIGFDVKAFSLLRLGELPTAWALLIFFIVLDFFQWATHIAMHRIPLFWKFHKVHHSVKEMGFAAHFRFHWMENILYKPLKTLGILILGGFEPEQAFIVHLIAILIGHLNHANIRLDYGPLRYLLNNPVMHLYHHAKELPKAHPYGVNFGISLSIWDYLFQLAYVPTPKAELELGYEGDHEMPSGFLNQQLFGLKKRS
jgi:sterol desaturase/sphingolipid hydroxylase (fatty acid hydroxylase superfamily)